MKKPLISFIVATFNQEEYIREAIENAFAQTYSPLEIIISDDCSKDRTFEIAQAMAAAYNGRHTVQLNRNPSTLGIGGHTNRLMELCRGELIVVAAGDDVSLPNRTEVIYQAWEHSGRRATSIFSSYTTINQDGTVRGVGGQRELPADGTPFRELQGGLFEFFSAMKPVVNGCTHAWTRTLFDYFGPLTTDLEDLVLSFRTLAIGSLLYIDQPLVKYRRHEANVSFFAEREANPSFNHRENRLRWVDEKRMLAYDNMIRDVETLCRKGRLTSAERDRLRAEAQRVRVFYQVERQMMDGNLARRWLTLATTVGQGNVRAAMRSSTRGLPRPLYRRLFLLRERWRHRQPASSTS